MKISATILMVLCGFYAYSQPSPLYSNLPLGKYNVGFKIVTIRDDSRVTRPLYNYFGEKDTSDRTKKITIHIWYPAKQGTGDAMVYSDYCFNHLLSATKDTLPAERRTSQVSAMRQNMQGFFGPMTDQQWQTLLATPMLARKEATVLNEKFPLLIGMLRPLSTSITNEMMASNGYIVAMVPGNNGRNLSLAYLSDFTDMQHAIAHINKSGMSDDNKIGTYGFSGSGFAQLLFAMNDPRILAYADLESALYGENIWTLFSASNLYSPAQMRVPFLHIYGKELAKRDTNFEDFRKKVYSDRYHVELNYPRLHHWDVATEGRASTTVLHLRGNDEPGIRSTYELANIYLLHFFDRFLKESPSSKAVLAEKKNIKGHADSLWNMHHHPAVKPPPNRDQFVEFINRNGIDEGKKLARSFRQIDPAADFIHQNVLNQLGRNFNSQGKTDLAIAMMDLAVEFHPTEAWIWNNRADIYENAGKKDKAIESTEKTLELLKDANSADQSFNGRIKRSAEERLKRLKK